MAKHKYISQDAAIDAVDVCNLHRGIIDALQAIISDIPSADVVEVVRCIDCIHYDDRWKRCFYWGKVSDIHVIERGYCWRAERRADNG